MVRLLLPADGPAWLQSFARSIERALREPRLPEFEAATLPDPANARGRQIIVSDIPALAYSNGTDWIRADTGATL